MGAFCLLLSMATGVDYGWMPEADGSLTYLIQLEPEVVAELGQPGFAIESVIPDDLRGVRRFKIYVGEGEVPRIGAPHAAVQAQWSQYVETDATGAASAAASSYTGAATDPYVGDRYLPEMFQAPDWQQRFYEWSDLAQRNLAGDAGANAGSAAPPLTLPNFGQDIAKLPGQVWNQTAQTMRDRGLDPTLATDRLKQEFQAGVADANAAMDRFGQNLANEANRTIGAWTGTEINRTAAPAAASSPIGTSGGGFAAAPAFPPATNPATAAPASTPGGLGLPAGPSLAAPATTAGGAFAPATALEPRSNPSVPAWNDGALGGSAAGGSLAGGGLGGAIGGGSSLDAPPLTGSNLGGSSLDANPAAGGSLAGGSLAGGSSLDANPGNMGGGLATGSSLDMPPSSNLGGPAGGSLGGGGFGGGASSLDGAGSLAGGGSSLDGGSLGGGSLGGGNSLGGSLDVPAIGVGDQPFGVPQIGGAAGDDNPFGVPIVARQEVAAERRTLPYSAIPVRPDFESDMLAGPAAIDVTPVSADGPAASWGWGTTFDDQGRPWGPLFVTAVILFLSVGLNCYLAWISRGLYERYKNLVFSRRHASTSAAV